MKQHYLLWGGLGLGLVLLLLYPFQVGQQPFWLLVGLTALFYATLAASWSLLAGYTGQFSFAHMAFMGFAAYVSGLLGRELGLSPWISTPLAVLATGLLGWAIGYLCLRLRATYLALFTIAFAEIFRLIVKAEVKLTGGPNGLELAPFWENASYVPAYYGMLAIFIISLLIMSLLVRSRYGFFFRAVREDEEAAAALGVHVVNTRVLAFVVSSMIAGLAGAVYHHYIGLIVPDEMIIGRMSLVIAMAVIGGSHNLVGAAIGAIFIHFALELLQEIPLPASIIAFLAPYQPILEQYGWGLDLSKNVLRTNAWRLVAFGILLMVTLRFWRNGLISPIIERLSYERAREGVAERFHGERTAAPELDHPTSE
ncbi:MAG: branched-chain amino acid ABC transporter permease [Ardenticatenia bacterium]|nr:MAG: branched-chain amino acid ABC transporter permease [Ardenticatenia bacterium]